MAYGVYMVAKKLKHYFEEHPIMVVSTTPLSEIIGCKDATGRVAKWAIELAAHMIQYKLRTTIKSQILADFFADCGENQYLPLAPDSTHWWMNFDGSKMRGGLGASIVLISPKGDKIHFTASNNITEYEALIHGLKLAKEIGIWRILCFGDADLVVHQVLGDWDANNTNMASYRFYVQQLYGFFEVCEFHHIPRANNDDADQLSKIGSTRQQIPSRVSLEIICKPSIRTSPESTSIYVLEDLAQAKAPLPNLGATGSEQEGATGPSSKADSTKSSGDAISRQPPAAGQPEEAGTSADPRAVDPLVASVFHIREIPSWGEPFSNYLLSRDLPASKVEARQLQHRARAYTLINSELYKRSMSGIYQKCFKLEEGQELLKEIHQGECGHHTSSRALVAKAFLHGFYWPTALKDAEWLVKSCNDC
jgi:ribonuclease HI